MAATVDFGKHKGRAWADVPVEYLHWIRDHEGGSHTKRPLALAELERRQGPREPRPVAVVATPSGLIELHEIGGGGAKMLLTKGEALAVANRLREAA